MITQNQLRILLLSLLLLPLNKRAHASPMPAPESSLQIRLFSDLSYFKSNANYDIGGGSYTRLTSGQYYQQTLSETGIEYWLSPEWSAIVQMGVAAAESTDGVFTRNNSGVTEIMAGSRYKIVYGDLYLVPEAHFSYPFNRVDKETDEVLTGEGAMSVEGGAWLLYRLGPFTPYGKLSYRYRDEGRAAHLVWLVGSDWKLGQFRPFFEGKGTMVAVSDQYTDNRAERDIVTARVNGSSYKFYAVNSTELALRAGTWFTLPWDLEGVASYEQTINGKAAAAGYTIRLGLQWQVGNEEYVEESEVKQFVPEEPDYNPELFHQPKPKIKAKRKARRKAAPNMNIDKSLEDVQKTLEQNQ